jgi:hypothetical protein
VGLSLLEEDRVDHTEPMVFSADETCDVGNDFGSPVTDGYPAEKRFSDHLITPEQRLNLAMAQQ